VPLHSATPQNEGSQRLKETDLECLVRRVLGDELLELARHEVGL